ncbi:MAG: hypothetical protein ABSD31_21850, partial [Candidatus Binataceae bacterium]
MPEEPPRHAAKPCQARDPYGLLAFSAYLALALLFFGRGLCGHFCDSYIGTRTDPSVSMWL